MDESPLDYIRRMKWRSAKPFHPFAFVLENGRRIDVLKAIWFGGSESIIGVYHPRAGLQQLDPKDVRSVRALTEQEVESTKALFR